MTEPIVHVVDDDLAVRKSMCRLMSSVGLPVRTYRSSQEFLETFDPGAPGCVVLDVRMPGMSGLELQERLNEREPPIPIIFVTAHADVPMAVRSLKAGAVDFIEKPFRPQVLLDRVQEAISQDASVRSERAEQRKVEERLARLTAREREVLWHVVAGETSRQIAARLGLSPKTIHVHRAEVMAKMEAGSVAELTRLVVAAGGGPS